MRSKVTKKARQFSRRAFLWTISTYDTIANFGR